MRGGAVVRVFPISSRFGGRPTQSHDTSSEYAKMDTDLSYQWM